MNLLLKLVVSTGVLSFVVFQACNTRPIPNVKETPDVRFETRIKPITSRVCSKCHNKWYNDLTNYDIAFSKRYPIYQRVAIDKSMPLGMKMDDEDRALFRDWYLQGSKK